VSKILGDVRLFWLCAQSYGNSITDLSQYVHDCAYMKAGVQADVSSFDAAPEPLGLGYALPLNGTDEFVLVPDHASLSFGDGAHDEAISAFVLARLPSAATTRALVSKWGNAAGEWLFNVNGVGRVGFICRDESAAASIGRRETAVVPTAAWALYAASYDASRSAAGLRVSRNGLRVDDLDDSAGAYVAMENLGAAAGIGASQPVGAWTDFWPGHVAAVVLSGRDHTPTEAWQIRELFAAYFDVTL